MPNIDNLFSPDGETPHERAADAWQRIQYKPSSITIKRGATTLAAQTVRVEANSTTVEVVGQGGGDSSENTVTAFGIRDHATLPNTNIQRDDVFSWNGIRHKVKHIIFQTGEIQALCEALA
jgi:hypothetical protein